MAKKNFFKKITSAAKNLTGDGLLPAIGRATGIQSKKAYDAKQAKKGAKADQAISDATIAKATAEAQTLSNKDFANEVNAQSTANQPATPAPNKKLMLYGGIAAGVLLIVIILVVILKGRG